ncbi:VOC family protein [Erwinia billingiae]|uniref:2-oxoadipate dioxygenase/decarboxylase HglS n=1 Tax=Erwinia billingiae TaxID=182337 RepID=UPI001243A007|nr:VOC family protein [Erwinia billingiae]QEW32372.1 VOC family protein [Erwinia billingiae]
MESRWVSADSLRAGFASAMSAMYQQEVPQYGTLLKLVSQVNAEVLAQNPALKQQLERDNELSRLSVERHGAIRVGTAAELAMLRQVFAIMGMYPVGYYDLSQAGVPVHSTAFRPLDDDALNANPFRLFTSLLRLELIDDPSLQRQAAEILAARDIFTPRCRELVSLHQQQGGLTAQQAEEFIPEVLETFRWHQQTTVDQGTYQALLDQHRLIADVVCFPGCHINHLTPRTLDIDRVQALMPEAGITPKAIIEGPPRREVPILLRQTSFKALDEAVRFRDAHQGTHTARFGEIEQRGIALTAKGRELYDRLLQESETGTDNRVHQQKLGDIFQAFPDDARTLRVQQLAWFTFRLSEKGRAYPEQIAGQQNIETLLDTGLISATPMIYEDFLPVSAAGIFQSNLGSETKARSQGHSSKAEFEKALGAAVQDEIALYAQRQKASLARCGVTQMR